MVSHEQRRTGPIPDAAELAAIRAVDPKALELIYTIVDRQQQHDHAMERATLDSETAYRRYGITAAVVVIGGMIGLAALALVLGHPNTAGAMVGIAGLTSMASVFVRGRNMMPMQADRPDVPSPYPSQAVPTHAPPSVRGEDRAPEDKHRG
jgi:uncharacterized membrane protein